LVILSEYATFWSKSGVEVTEWRLIDNVLEQEMK